MEAFSYVRFSTKHQSSGTSLERQIKASKLFCVEHQLELSERHYKDLGVSGFKSVQRPELEQMLEAIKTGDIPKGSYILIEAIDRLSRKGISHTQTILREILEQDVKVAFVGEDAKTLQGQILDKNSLNEILDKNSLNDLASVILVALAADLAYKESLRKSRLIKSAKKINREKAEQGAVLPGRVAFWLRYENNQYAFNEHLSTIRLIIDSRLKGQGPRAIAIMLNNLGIKSPRGTHWAHSTIIKCIKNPALYGFYQSYQIINSKQVPDISVKDYFPAVITEQEFVQIQIDSKRLTKGRTSHQNPFSGLVRCECGKSMGFQVTKTPQKEYQYFYCLGFKQGVCKNKAVRDLSPLLIELMDRLKINQVKKKDNSSEIIKTKQAKIEQLNELLIELDEPPLSVMKNISRLEKELKELLTEKPKDIAQQDVSRLSSITDATEYNLQLKRIVQRITIYQLGSSKNLRIKVQMLDGHFQQFVINNGQVLFNNDTKKLLNTRNSNDLARRY